MREIREPCEMPSRARIIAMALLALPVACCPDPPAPAPGSASPAPAPGSASPATTSRPPTAPPAPAQPVATNANSAPPSNRAGVSSAELLDSHAAQLARLPSLVSGGILELSWDDDKGHHFEQGDLDLRYRAPSELSLRLSKVGETQFMGGCNARAWWWFEGWSKPTRFWSRPRSASRDPDDASRPPITMDEMLALLGLRELGRTSGAAEKVPEDPIERSRFFIDLTAQESVLGLPTRTIFDLNQVRGDKVWVPVRIEVRDSKGSLLIASDLEEYKRIERGDAAPGDWPAIATRVRVEVPERGERGAFRWLVVLDRTSASGDRIVEKLFDPDAVKSSLRPQLVDDGSAESSR